MRYGVLLVTLAGAFPITSAYADKITAQETVSVATHSQNVAFDYSARKMLGYVSEARTRLNNEHKGEAAAYLDSAIAELNSIRNTRSYLDAVGLHFGRVLYGENNSYYIPIADDTYAVRTYARGPFWTGTKASAVRDVQLVNVDIAINPEKAMAHLQMAKQQLSGGDFKTADNELRRLLDESLHQTTSVSQPFTRLQDNIYLTRVLLRQQNYDGARYTLRNAKAALSDYEKTIATPEARTSADNLHKEIVMLDETIQSRDPTLMREASDKVEHWWNDLKGWTKKKTS